MQRNQVFTVMPWSKRWRRKSRRWQIPWSSFQPSDPQVNQDSPHCRHIAHGLRLWPACRLSNPPIVQSGALASFYETGCSEVLNALDRGTLFPFNKFWNVHVKIFSSIVMQQLDAHMNSIQILIFSCRCTLALYAALWRSGGRIMFNSSWFLDSYFQGRACQQGQLLVCHPHSLQQVSASTVDSWRGWEPLMLGDQVMLEGSQLRVSVHLHHPCVQAILASALCT